jgi:hypothetical protein
MEWIEIEKDLPLAYDMLIGEPGDEIWVVDSYSKEPVYTAIDGHDFTERLLYDFFDENKIFIDIDHEFGEDWTYCIDQEGTGHDGTGLIYKSRSEAEQAAFTEAFKILNDKLKNQ